MAMIVGSRGPRGRALRMPVLAALLGVLAGCHTGTIHTSTSGSVTVENESASVEVVFGDRERRRIRDYYERRLGGLPPGLAKKKRLPPGLRKHVERHGELPPGLRGEPLPRELERELRDLPEDYVRLRVGYDVVLMNRDTRVVVDIVKDVGGQ